MVKSMTGYGRAEDTVAGCTITVELRSVNNRYLDCNVRMPRLYLFAEEAIKSRVQNTISRGKVDVFVTLDNTGAEQVKVSVNRPVADGYFAALKELAGTYELPQDISVSLLSRFPDVLLAEKTEEDLEGRAAAICAVLDRALADFDQMRTREGARLETDVLSRAARIEELVEEYEVEKIVLGLPKHMNNDIGDRAEKSMQFGEMIGRRTGLEVVMWDERLTTVSAERTLIENKVRREDRKKYIDQIAAVFILQGYLDSAHLNKEG